MTEPIVACPNCNATIPLTESLAAPLLRATKLKYEQVIASRDRSIAEREAAMNLQRKALEDDRAAFEQRLEDRLRNEREQIVASERTRAQRLAAADLDARAQELDQLREILKQRDEKLAEAQSAQAALLRKERELEDERREFELTLERRVQSEVAAARATAKLEVEEPLKLRVIEKEEQIASMQRQIEELKRRAEQGSQQLQGEAQELHLETTLRAKFPTDTIDPVPKGEFGGDIRQSVVIAQQVCGVILWESKRTKHWSDGWLAKLRDDQRRAEADVALIVSSVLPKGVNGFGCVDGVWVTEPRYALALAVALRSMLVEVAQARIVREGQRTKMELIYAYLTGPHFRQRLASIVERASEMQSDLDKERAAITRMWAKREKQIRGVIESTSGMFGDLQGIAGRSLEEIDVLSLQMIQAPEAA